jgi:23S rRNA pseudouridine1911/1915/1917 synthase
MAETTIEASETQAGRRLDVFLAEGLGLSRARVRYLLEAGRVREAERVLQLADKSRRVEPGERFEVLGALRAEEERPVAWPDLGLSVVGEGEGWLVVDKPAGLGVHPLAPEQEQTVLNAVVAAHPEILGVGEGGLRSGVVHRLDVETSGALAFALEEEAWRRLRGAFAAHRVHKRYRALVAGRFEAARRIDLPLLVARHRPARVEVRAGGRPTRQRARPLAFFEHATLVEVELETGFLHQIRATMAHLGHPVLGDREYQGEGSSTPIEVPRPMLHAAALRFEEIGVEVPDPPDFAAVLDRLGEAGTP